MSRMLVAAGLLIVMRSVKDQLGLHVAVTHFASGHNYPSLSPQ